MTLNVIILSHTSLLSSRLVYTNLLLFNSSLKAQKRLKCNEETEAKAEQLPLLPHLQGSPSLDWHYYPPGCSDQNLGSILGFSLYIINTLFPTIHFECLSFLVLKFFLNPSVFCISTAVTCNLGTKRQHSFSFISLKCVPNCSPCFHCCFPV